MQPLTDGYIFNDVSDKYRQIYTGLHGVRPKKTVDYLPLSSQSLLVLQIDDVQEISIRKLYTHTYV
jgi:hypothetical protein